MIIKNIFIKGIISFWTKKKSASKINSVSLTVPAESKVILNDCTP